MADKNGHMEAEIRLTKDMTGSLSSAMQADWKELYEILQSGEATLEKDSDGKPQIKYRKVQLSHVDPSETLKIVTPKSESDMKMRTDVCLELIKFAKSNNAPAGVVFDRTKVRTSKLGEYRECVEFSVLNEVLGTGGIAGDILVVKDNQTGSIYAQKTVLISVFRPEEIKAWVDLDGEGLCPALYCFHIKDNKVVFHMEKLSNAVTVRDIIDNRISKIYESDESLVRPFALYMFHGLLSCVKAMHEKNWIHGDLHGANVMLQKGEGKMSLKVLDFGKAKQLRSMSGGYNLREERDDIYQVVRLFTALYCGQEFESTHDLTRNYKNHLQHLPKEDRKELFQLIEAALYVAEKGENLKHTIQTLEEKLDGLGDFDLRMRQVAAILFSENDYIKLHERDTTDSGAATDLDSRAREIPDDFMEEIRLGINLKV